MKGQSWSLQTPYHGNLDKVTKAFYKLHKKRYGYVDSSQPVEIVAIGVRAGVKQFLDLPIVSSAEAKVGEKVVRAMESVYQGVRVKSRIIDRDILEVGFELTGPCIVTQSDSTTFIAPDWTAITDSRGNLRISKL